MNPYVIDRSKLNFYIFFAVILIITSFFSGYYLAQYRAETVLSIIQAESVIKSEMQLGDKTDIDEAETSLTDPGYESELNKDSPAINSKQPGVPNKPAAKPPVISPSKPVAARVKKPVTKTVAEATTPTAGLASASVSSDKLKYSVQAGLFGSQENANKFLYQLQMAGFDGYMEEHQGDDGLIRYNVRFGRFASRTDAEQRLAEYRQGFSTPAYVIINP